MRDSADSDGTPARTVPGTTAGITLTRFVTPVTPGTDAAKVSADVKSSLLDTFPSSTTSRVSDTNTLSAAWRKVRDGAVFSFSVTALSILKRRSDWYFRYPKPTTSTDAKPRTITIRKCFSRRVRG